MYDDFDLSGAVVIAVRRIVIYCHESIAGEDRRSAMSDFYFDWPPVAPACFNR